MREQVDGLMRSLKNNRRQTVEDVNVPECSSKLAPLQWLQQILKTLQQYYSSYLALDR
jgi:hypothetical protein